MGINSLIDAKRRYHRAKDETDLMLLMRFRDTYLPSVEENKQNKTSSDLNALDALKAKMEEEL